MILEIAWKNFYRQGVRAFLNVLVTAFTMIALIFMLSLLNGFQAQATRNMVTTDMAGGQYRVPDFDISWGPTRSGTSGDPAGPLKIIGGSVIRLASERVSRYVSK